MIKHQSKDFLNEYDHNVVAEGEQSHIDIYYQPKAVENKRRVDIVMKYVNPRPEQRILDLGCGVGTFAYHCCRKGALCWGLDFSAESTIMAQALCQKLCDSNTPKFITADAAATPFDDNFFDTVVCADFVEHISLQEKKKVVSEIKRILKPGGKAVIFTPNRIRENIGEQYWKIRVKLFGGKLPRNDLHFGLTDRNEFEPLLKDAGLKFRMVYADTTRPWLASVPVLKHWLALNLIWVIQKDV